MFHTYRCVYSDADHFYDHFTRDWDLILENLICPFDEDVCRMLGNYFYKRATRKLPAPALESALHVPDTIPLQGQTAACHN